MLTDDLIIKICNLTPTQLEILQKEQLKAASSLANLIIDQKIMSEKELTKRWAKFIGVPFVTIYKNNIPASALELLSPTLAKQHQMIIFKVTEDGVIHLALADPTNQQLLNFLHKELGSKIKFYLATKKNILNAVKAYDDYQAESENDFSIPIETKQNLLPPEPTLDDALIMQTLKELFNHAITNHASDIHIFFQNDFTKIKYRIDGILRLINYLPITLTTGLIDRIKVMAGIPQSNQTRLLTGNFTIKLYDTRYQINVSLLPTVDGDSLVLRLTELDVKPPTLRELGLWGNNLKLIQNLADNPNKMTVISGPSDSGCSTISFSLLNQLQSKNPNTTISTLEHQVTHRLKKVNQINLENKNDAFYADNLQILLKQQPDVILLDNPFGAESITLAIKAVLSGRTVISTMLFPSAVKNLTYLINLPNVEAYLIASTMNMFINQRLVRTLCPHCRERVVTSLNQQKLLANLLGLNSSNTLQRLHLLEQQAIDEGLNPDLELNSTEDSIHHHWRANKNGCKQCNFTGYLGRTGIFEILQNNTAMQNFITSLASASEIRNLAIDQGMIDLPTDGIVKVLRGITSLSEVIRSSRNYNN